jgi:hypothetical protein
MGANQIDTWPPPEFAPGSGSRRRKFQAKWQRHAKRWVNVEPMRTLLGSFRSRYGFDAGCFLCALLAALFLPLTASAGDLENSTGKSADREGPPSSFSLPKRPLVESAPRWAVSAEAIVLGRIRGVNQTLVERVPGTVPFFNPPYDTSTAPGVEASNSNQFRQGFSAGPKISLTYHDDSGYGVELSYFNIFDQSASKTIGPDNPPDWLVMKAPGIFWQTQDFSYQGMAWRATTNLYNVEANGRLDITSRVTLLAGVRWLQLNDDLEGTLTPEDRSEPTWKSNPLDRGYQSFSGRPAPPGWVGRKLPAILEYGHDEQPLWRPNRRGRKNAGVRPLIGRRAD